MIKAKKSTMATVKNFGFGLSEIVSEMDDYGFTVNVKSTHLEIMNGSDVVDYGHPYTVKMNGETYGMIIFSEMSSGIEIEGEYYSTSLDQIDY